MSESQAHVILQRAQIKPHRTEYRIMSDFSREGFEQRMGEVCGLYIDPPENVLVVSIDEKTGIQAKARRSSPTGRRRRAGRPRASTSTSATAPSACSPR